MAGLEVSDDCDDSRAIFGFIELRV